MANLKAKSVTYTTVAVRCEDLWSIKTSFI